MHTFPRVCADHLFISDAIRLPQQIHLLLAQRLCPQQSIEKYSSRTFYYIAYPRKFLLLHVHDTLRTRWLSELFSRDFHTTHVRAFLRARIYLYWIQCSRLGKYAPFIDGIIVSATTIRPGDIHRFAVCSFIRPRKSTMPRCWPVVMRALHAKIIKVISKRFSFSLCADISLRLHTGHLFIPKHDYLRHTRSFH